MIKLYFVSYTDDDGHVVLDLHIGTKPLFVKKGLQMVTDNLRVNHVFMLLDDKNTK